MQTHIGKWGNSLAIRLPKAVVEQLRLEAGASVEMRVENGALHIGTTPKKYKLKGYTIEQLLDGITPENQHPLLLDDEPQGDEFW